MIKPIVDPKNDKINPKKELIINEKFSLYFFKAHFIREKDQIFLLGLMSNKTNKQCNKLLIYKIDKII